MTTIRSVARASRILVHLGEQPEGRTAKEVADALSLPLPTAYHLLGTLVAEGLAAKDSRRRYRLGPALGPIADAFVRQFSPPEYLIAPLHRLADETGETAYVGAWRHDRIVVLASVEGGTPYASPAPISATSSRPTRVRPGSSCSPSPWTRCARHT